MTFVTAESAPADEANEAHSLSTPSSPSPSPSSNGAFLLSSTPLADEEPRRRPSAGEDELEIISKEELEAARNESDWSDVDSEL